MVLTRNVATRKVQVGGLPIDDVETATTRRMWAVPDDHTDVTLRSIAAAAFVPPTFYFVCVGAITPIIPLTATSLGASPAMAATIVALTGIGQALADAPAGALTARFGERTVMVVAAATCAVSLVLAALTTSLVVFASAILVVGFTMSIWVLARVTFVAETVPRELLARAMSTLGGVQRVGQFIGPFAGAGAIQFLGPRAAYWVGVVAVMAATAALVLAHENPITRPARLPATEHTYRSMLRGHARAFRVLGSAIVLVGMVRASRQVVLPLWGEHLHLGATEISLIYGASGVIDMLVFYPAGWLMDHRGRAVAAVASMIGLGVTHLLIPLTASALTFTAVAVLMGLGNGLGAGLVMTIGTDMAPPQQRAAFLGAWRVTTDVGTSTGPLALAGITAVASLGVGAIAMGVGGLVAAIACGHWIPRYARIFGSTPT